MGIRIPFQVGISCVTGNNLLKGMNYVPPDRRVSTLIYCNAGRGMGDMQITDTDRKSVV